MRKKIYAAIVATTLMFTASTICVAQTRKIKCSQSGEATPENPFYGCSYHAENDETWSAPFDIGCNVKPNFQGKAKKSTQYMNVYFIYDFDREVEKKDSVVCQFTASANGTVDNVKVLHGISPKYDNDVADIIKATPNWSPGKKVVVVYFRNIAIGEARPAGENNDDDENYIAYYGETNPGFPGGKNELAKWLPNHIKYPQKCVDEGITGKVICTFVVEEDGSLSNIKVLRSVHPLLDEEAVRLIKAMPKWTIDKQYGNPVRVKYVFPIKFVCQ